LVERSRTLFCRCLEPFSWVCEMCAVEKHDNDSAPRPRDRYSLL
jgi:hypothetical protein